MTSTDDNASTAAKKIWSTPEIRDQSIKSLTESKGNVNPKETSALTGPSAS